MGGCSHMVFGSENIGLNCGQIVILMLDRVSC